MNMKMMSRVSPWFKRIFFLGSMLLFYGCVHFAPPTPLFTYGGPKTTKHKTSEAAIAVGTGVALFEGAHSGAHGWFGRYKYGLGEKTDLGIDFMGIIRQDEGAMALKLAHRYQLANHIRLETGFGAADDSDGKSLGADLGLTAGTLRNKPWNFYSTLRVAVAKGYPGDIVFSDGMGSDEDSVAPPDTWFTLLNLGAEGQIDDRQRFIFEVGYGYLFPYNSKRTPAFYFSSGLIFSIGKK
ncbi:MAG: hypothetical protein ACRBF0_13835 [Calditrichia bacterium]